MSQQKSIREVVSIGDGYKCGAPECRQSNNDADLVFKSRKDFQKHRLEKHASDKVTGSTICKFCKQPYIYSNKQGKGCTKDRPCTADVVTGDIMHPECFTKHLAAKGLKVVPI